MKWHLSVRRIQILYSEGRVPVAISIGDAWAIQSDAEKPADKRENSDNYFKEKSEDTKVG